VFLTGLQYCQIPGGLDHVVASPLDRLSWQHHAISAMPPALLLELHRRLRRRFSVQLKKLQKLNICPDWSVVCLLWLPSFWIPGSAISSSPPNSSCSVYHCWLASLGSTMNFHQQLNFTKSETMHFGTWVPTAIPVGNAVGFTNPYRQWRKISRS